MSAVSNVSNRRRPLAALDAAQMALRYAVGSGVRLDNPLQRLVREFLVAQSHVHVVETNYDKLGLALLAEAVAGGLGCARVDYR